VGRQVEQLVTTQPQINAQELAKASVVVQGLSAYEYILFDAEIDMANAEQKARYCPLLMAIGER
ncbi:putative Lipoprotein, partial [Pseudomonas syringae pv. maculicola]